MTGIAVSVLTPTYNRAQVLHRVYESLQRQNMRNFEWVVVDDGSTDETPDLLACWQAEADFPVTWYRYSNNRGKSAAANSGHKLVSGEYTVIMDSDDAFLDDAMETIDHWRRESDIDNTPSAYAMIYRCMDEHGNLVGRRFYSGDTEIELMSRLEARYRHGITFETCIVAKTATAKTIKFFELTQSENCPPGIADRIASKSFDAFYIDRPVRRYFLGDGIDRLSGGLSSTVRWSRGNYLMSLAMLNDDIKHFRDNPGAFLKVARRVATLGFHIGRSPWRQYGDLAHGHARLLWMAGLPRSFVRYLRDKRRGRKAPRAHPDIAAWGPAVPPENPVLRLPPARFGKPYPPGLGGEREA